MSIFQQVKDIWGRLPMGGKIATIGAAVATVGLIGAMVYYGSQPEYGVLFSDLKAEDAQTIVEKLKASGVPYSLTNNGTTIQVPHEKISELRLQIASAGVLSGGHVGFDLFDKTSFGATDFAQQVNYQRAIEGEIAKTLEGMEEVEGARVHISPKKESVFTEKTEGAKASVMLRVKQGKELSNERTDAIVSLVSSAIEGLDPSNVSVMDSRGRLLTAGGRAKNGAFTDAGAFHAQLEAKQKYEQETAARVIALLEPVIGENRVRADISADVDFSQVEQTEERYNPQSQVVRSQQNTQEVKNSARNTPLAVGARANDPTAPPPAGANTAPPQNNNLTDQRTSTTTNYEIDKTTKKTIGGGGRINRLTVSVVVDNKTVNGVDAARTPEEVKQIQDLVAAAVGTDQNRGDSVVVQTMAFDKPEAVAENPKGFFENNKSLLSSAMKYGALLLIAGLIFFFVIRPARKALQIAATPPEEQKLLESAETTVEEALAEEEKRLSEGVMTKQLEENTLPEIKPMMTVAELEAKLLQGDEEGFEIDEEIDRVEEIKKQVTEQTLREPEVVVSTLRGWLREA